MQTITTMPDTYHVHVTNNRPAVLAALTALAQRTDPMQQHGGLLLDVLEALVRGGLDVWGLIDDVMAEVVG